MEGQLLLGDTAVGDEPLNLKRITSCIRLIWQKTRRQGSVRCAVQDAHETLLKPALIIK